MHNMDSSRVLLVGGAGYVGRAVANLLESSAITFAVFDNFSVGDKALVEGKGWEYFEEDVTDEQAVHRCIEQFKPTHIVVLAALHFIPYCIQHPRETEAVNVTGLQNVVGAIVADHTDTQLLFVSSAAVYQDADKALSEEDPLGPIDIYGETKLKAEHLVRAQLFNYKIVRLFNVFGRSDPHPHVIPRIFQELSKDASRLELGDLTPKRDYVHVDDVASGILAVLKEGKNRETYNIGTGSAHSVDEVVQQLFGLCNVSPTIAANSAGYTRKTDRQLLCADIKKITSDTSWRPKYDLVAGLETLGT